MDASEKLDRFSKGVIFEAALASVAAVPDGDGLESGTFISVLYWVRLSLIRSGLPEKSCAIH